MKKIRVMVDGLDGLPENIAMEVAKAINHSPDMELVPFGMTGPDTEMDMVMINDLPIKLFKPHQTMSLITYLEGRHPDVTCNYTLPGAIKKCVDLYTTLRLPFILGTTGGDLLSIKNLVAESSINAIVAANTVKEIVAVQMMIKHLAESAPLLFKDYYLQITESHQSTKVDTSETAKEMISMFNQLGIKFTVDPIVKKKSEKDYAKRNEHWGGHGYHTYSLKKKDGSIVFEFTHNINDQPDVNETLDAIRFLHKNESTQIVGGGGKVFSMEDVLKG